MRACQQTANQNTLQHGLSVWKHTFRLLTSDDLSGFRLPSWWDQYKAKILENTHSFKTIKHYAIWHDCGKPFTLEIDSEGKRHFPNHAAKSAETFREYIRNDETICRLIGNDMLMHTHKYEDIMELGLSTKDICTHLIIALAELHANAEHFGGIESESFKIKFKRYEKLGKKLCYQLFDHSYVYVISRNDLTPAQKAVQGTHAAIEVARNFMKPQDEHPSLVLCVVKNENKLKKVIEELYNKNIRLQAFREPDLGNALTAIATEPLKGDARAPLARFQLLN